MSAPQDPEAPAAKQRKGGIIKLFQAELPSQRTYICMGVKRGGTSAVAGTLSRLGIPMGPKTIGNHEEGVFQNRPLEEMREAIKSRNAQHDVWGWKYPDAHLYLEDLLADVRNPHLIVVYRDLAASLNGLIRWHGLERLEAGREVLDAHRRNLDLIEGQKLPTLLISYEKAMVYPSVFVRHMARALELPRPRKPEIRNIVQFLQPGSYKK